jgi:hypothetical protein
MFCPKRELEWLEGWTYDMVYSSAGYAEQDCVFKTENPVEGPAVWIVSQYLPPQMVEYVRMAPETLVLRFSVCLSELAENITEIHVNCSFTGLTEKGNQCIDNYVNILYPQRMDTWKRSLDQYFQRNNANGDI